MDGIVGLKRATFAGPGEGRVLHADVAKLADALDLGSNAVRHEGSTPFVRTLQGKSNDFPFFYGRVP
jgi:hypothetical protein